MAAISRSHSDFLISRAMGRDERFRQFLAFGFDFTHERAVETVDWFVRCKQDWTRSGREEVYRSLSPQDQNTLIADLLERVIKDSLARDDDTRPLSLGISAGFDSRTILHALCRCGITPVTYTYGQIGNLDFDLIRNLSEHHGWGTKLFDTSEIEWSLDVFDQETSSRQDIPVSPRVLAKHEMDYLVPGRIDIHGYLGGFLTGQDLPSQASLTWEAAVAAYYKKNDPFDWHSLVPIDSSLPDQPFVEAEVLPFDMQLDAAYRQRQRIRLVSEPEPRDLLFPFEDRRWVGFWLSRVLDELAGQKRYVNFIRSLDGAVFDDLQECGGTTRAALRGERIALVYGADGRTGLAGGTNKGKELPKNPTAHFCLFACYRNNASFRRRVERSLRRLRSRQIFAASFIDETKRRFESGESRSDKMLNGLVSTDLALEARLFDLRRSRSDV